MTRFTWYCCAARLLTADLARRPRQRIQRNLTDEHPRWLDSPKSPLVNQKGPDCPARRRAEKIVPVPRAGKLKRVKLPRTQVSCGALHIGCLLDDSRVVTWGSGDGGRLGHGDTRPRNTPTVVQALAGEAVAKVLCSVWHR